MSISFSPTQVRILLDVEHGEYGGPRSDVESVLVSRAYSRFNREFDAYLTGSKNLSAVRKYHRLLTDALDDFARAKAALELSQERQE